MVALMRSDHLTDIHVTSTKTTVYITKHALTIGILRVDAHVDDETGDAWVPVMGRKFPEFVRRLDVHRTLPPARERAEHLRVAKIQSLLKQIKKLETLSIKEMP